MKLPRDVSGEALAKLVVSFGYVLTRQTASHMRLTTREHGEHHITIPKHKELRVGTLGAIIAEIADHFGLAREDVGRRMFG